MRREGSITTGNTIVEHPPQGDDKEGENKNNSAATAAATVTATARQNANPLSLPPPPPPTLLAPERPNFSSSIASEQGQDC